MADSAPLTTLLGNTRVIPVLVIEQLEQAVPLAQALVRGGLTVLEITLRTPVALDAIRAIREAEPGALVGAGTVINGENIEQATTAGASFLVSPGSTPSLLDAADNSPIPLLPGASTASEAMALQERGYTLLKFFPAEAAGGVAMLRSLGGPLPKLRFCPTGGINLDNAASYLALNNVACVGGSWMVPAKYTAANDWPSIEALASRTAEL